MERKEKKKEKEKKRVQIGESKSEASLKDRTSCLNQTVHLIIVGCHRVALMIRHHLSSENLSRTPDIPN